MQSFILVSQIVVAILLMLVILSQEKGVAAGGTFGGSGMVFHGRRGVDRVLLWLTVTLAVLFVALSLAFIFVKEPTVPNAAPSEEASGGPGLSVENVEVTPEAVAPEASE